MEKKKGIIKRISVKTEGRNAFTLQEDVSRWYNGYSLDGAKVGDEIEFDLEINKSTNPTGTVTFYNYKNVSVVDYVKGEGYESTALDHETPQPKPTDSVQRYRTPEEMTAAEILKGAVELVKGQTDIENIEQSLENCCGILEKQYKKTLSNVKAL